MKNKYFLSALLLSAILGNAQENEPKTDSLKEVIVSSSRIDLPFKENSRTIQIITATDIKKLGVTNAADALQQVAGIVKV